MCLIFSAFIILGELIGFITFGYGLGDWQYLIWLIVLLIIISIATHSIIKTSKMEPVIPLLLIFIVILILFFTLKITILRGPEYKWNNNIFYNVL